MPQPKVNCYEFIKKRGFTNIDFLGVKGLLRLAAQKEGAKAQICLLRRTNYASLPHKTNYTRGEKLLQQIFLRNLGGWFDSFDYAHLDKLGAGKTGSLTILGKLGKRG
jgi:hypothetical protein